MDGGSIAVVVAVVVNIGVTAFSAGKLYQKVNDLSDRTDGVGTKLDKVTDEQGRLSGRVSKIEGKLSRNG